MRFFTAMRLGGFFFVLMMTLPFTVRSVTLTDYTKRRFTLTGGFGLGIEEYDYCRGPGDYERRRIREEVALNSSGFVWDPRFLSFDAGVMFYGEHTSTSDGDSDNELLGYRLGTIWFGHRRNPLSISAARQRNVVADYLNPSYELDTETLGVQWGWNNGLLGHLDFSFDAIDAESDGELVPRDESSDVIAIEGKRRFTREGGSSSNVTYGYRSIDTEDVAVGSAQRQRNWYAYDRTELGDSTTVNSNLTYYDREDVWSDAADASRRMDTTFFAVNSGLSVQLSESTRHHYSVALSRNRVAGTLTETGDVRGGVTHALGSGWELQGGVGFSSRSVEMETRDDNVFSDASGGFRYTRAFDKVQVRAGYAFGFEAQLDVADETDPGNSLTHALDAGIAHRWRPEFQDAIDYYASWRQGRLGIAVEHNLRYSANLRIGADHELRGAAEYRRYEDSAVGLEQGVDSSRVSVNWTYRLYGANTLNLSAGQNLTRGDNRFEQTYAQARLTFSPRRWRRLRFTGLTRWEERVADFGGEQNQSDVEGSLVYLFGRWETSVQYRYREFDGEELDFTREQTLSLFVRRNFAARF